jgi:drug/metabolite transporter superfamily protein YnfA
LNLDFADLAASVKVSLGDLFGSGDSFYYELAHPDFASALAIAALFATGFGVLLSLVRDEKHRVPIALAILLAVVGLLVPNLAPNYPGLRRATAFLFGVYLLYALALAELVHSREIPEWARRTSIAALMLLPMSHLVGYYESFAHAPTPSRHHFGRWFGAMGTPRDSLAYWLEFTERERFLPACEQAYSPPEPRCRYGEIFAALSGHRRWNGEAPVSIEVGDPVSGERIELTTDLWVSRHFEH